MTEDQHHQVSITWKHHRLRSDAQMQKGKTAALEVLSSGGTPRDATKAFIKAMYEGQTPIFDGFMITINGQRME